jgi:hypothetical protein
LTSGTELSQVHRLAQFLGADGEERFSRDGYYGHALEVALKS